MIIATAGHVDHGKTSLIRQLTGVDTDRLPEEKKRGLTIDIGFAYLPLEHDTLGFVDVPGHEKFLSNMLAGVGGVDAALLVVACDDGVMPQTREHLAILDLLGVKRGVVALSKADLVDPARVDAVGHEVRALLAGTALADIDCLPVSAATGVGLDQLQQRLLALSADRSAQRDRRFRLAIDRAFTLSGSGLVVTGTVQDGRIRVGDSVWLSGVGRTVRVRSLHAMNRPVDEAHAGQRLALNLTGDVARDDIRRGDWLLAGPQAPVDRIDVMLTAARGLDKALVHWQPVHLHAAAAHVTGRVALLDGDTLEPGGRRLAQLVLDSPLFAAAGDRLIVRDGSARHTLAGAVMLDPNPPSRGKRKSQRLALLAALDGADDGAALGILATAGSVDLPRFAEARGLTPEQVGALAAEQRLVVIDSRDGRFAYTAELWQAQADTLLARLLQEHETRPDQAGIGPDRLRRLVSPNMAAGVFARLIDELLAAGRLGRSGSWLHLPGFALAFAPADEALWLRIRDYFKDDNFEPWWVRDLASLGECPEDTMRQLLKQAARLGHVCAIVPDRYFAGTTVRRLATIVREIAERDGLVTAASFRDHIGGGRKLAIQILEFFDRSGFLRRQGDTHRLRDSGLF